MYRTSEALTTVARMVVNYRQFVETGQDDVARLLERSIWQTALEAIADGEVDGLEIKVIALAALKTVEAGLDQEL